MECSNASDKQEQSSELMRTMILLYRMLQEIGTFWFTFLETFCTPFTLYEASLKMTELIILFQVDV